MDISNIDYYKASIEQYSKIDEKAKNISLSLSNKDKDKVVHIKGCDIKKLYNAIPEYWIWRYPLDCPIGCNFEMEPVYLLTVPENFNADYIW